MDALRRGQLRYHHYHHNQQKDSRSRKLAGGLRQDVKNLPRPDKGVEGQGIPWSDALTVELGKERGWVSSPVADGGQTMHALAAGKGGEERDAYRVH